MVEYTRRNHLSAVTLGSFLGLQLCVGNIAVAGSAAEIVERLKNATPDTYAVIERELENAWSRSGSASADLLLQRGRDSVEAGDFKVAIGHLTALVDHAPEFAEGWNARATAYFNLEMYGPALDDIRQALVLNPNHYKAMSGFGIILERCVNLQAALDAFRKAASIHPNREDIATAIERLEREVGGQQT